MRLYTIGFTKKSAREFFELLNKHNIETVIDVRLNNSSQLAGFAKKNDLEYLLKTICNIKYKHYDTFAPTKEILDDYKKKIITWSDYELQFNNLLFKRNIANTINESELNNACLLCSESSANKCHRRLVAEFLKSKIEELEVIHL